MRLGWKTVLGALTAAVGIATSPAALGVLPGATAGALKAVGVLVTAIGARHAIAQQAGDVALGGFKTVGGALLFALGVLFSPEVMAVLPPTWAEGLKALGTLLGLVGLRVAIAKTGPGVVTAAAVRSGR